LQGVNAPARAFSHNQDPKLPSQGFWRPAGSSGGVNLAEWRRRIDQYWFWDGGSNVLTKKQVLECIIIGDTLEGDELIVHPDNPERVYVLPRHSEDIYIAGNGLPAVIEWLCGSGTLTEPFVERNFEPFDSR